MDKKLNIVFWILIGLLLLPLVQQTTGIVHERKLKGSFRIADLPQISAEGWFSGAFQEDFESAMNDRFGFHNLFIRINNQVAYSLFRRALANGVVVGKKDHLYELNYIKAALGADFLGDSVIESRTRKLKVLQDYFDEEGKHFLVCFAAGKGSFYPEYFPVRYRVPRSGKTNLEAYREWFDTYKINYIDFNAWFLEMKDTSRYCLYPRTGVHWSYYGMVRVIDSLTNYLENETRTAMPDFTWGDIKESRHYRSSDRDIEDGMNSIFRINYDKLAYPTVNFIDKDVKKLKGVIIADSFYWGLHNTGFSKRIFDEGEYWYYNKRIIEKEPVELDSVNRLDRLQDKDVIIMMVTEATLGKFPFGFENLLKEPLD